MGFKRAYGRLSIAPRSHYTVLVLCTSAAAIAERRRRARGGRDTPAPVYESMNACN